MAAKSKLLMIQFSKKKNKRKKLKEKSLQKRKRKKHQKMVARNRVSTRTSSSGRSQMGSQKTFHRSSSRNQQNAKQ